MVSDEVNMLTENDPLLENEENQELRRKIDIYLEKSLEKINL